MELYYQTYKAWQPSTKLPSHLDDVPIELIRVMEIKVYQTMKSILLFICAIIYFILVNKYIRVWKQHPSIKIKSHIRSISFRDSEILNKYLTDYGHRLWYESKTRSMLTDWSCRIIRDWIMRMFVPKCSKQYVMFTYFLLLPIASACDQILFIKNRYGQMSGENIIV